MPIEDSPPQSTPSPPSTHSPSHRVAMSWKIPAFVTLILVLTGLIGYVLALTGRPKKSGPPLPSPTAKLPSSPTPTPTLSPTPTPTPALVPSHLNGSLVSPGTEALRPLAIMVENHPEARPQYGLGEADLVYEAIAEGGITRFMAVFGNPNQNIRVGPVRSARPYYVDYAAELGAMYAHAGGSVDGLAEIPKLGVADLNGLTVGAPTFYRDTSRNVAYEHTLYTNTGKLWQLATQTYHWPTAATYSPWIFQDDIPASQRPPSQTISVSVSEPLYAVTWKYDSSSNSYARFMAGSAHNDALTGKQIEVKDVILQTVQHQDYTEHYGNIAKPVTRYTLTGSGSAVIFKNGTAIKASWKKESDSDRTRYYDANGQEIPLTRGEIWIQLVDSSSVISY